MTAALVGEIVWVLGVVAWYVIRYPFVRRAKRVRVVTDGRSYSETIGLASALFGLAIMPMIYVTTGIPKWANYATGEWAIALGTLVYVFALWLFRIAHKGLGRNWSVTLQIREQHKLVRTGLYSVVRHPMYTSFLLMGIGQALLLPNWVAGLSGVAGFAVLFFLRVDKEERMMLEAFGPEYRSYMTKTKKILPYLY